ncbi:fumarylacetoacetate hydrolase family protein [Streptomyces varsoviensis]|uniref:Fumarylacetoacetate hydrolase n=1 Tax=Streptomyces varsoviensis TaxID=67373 RepID=A0ABR5IYG2_9ACTN|nr:fumarylacetoacetate hydrolase family protein [Streptomyces varsoviensis]KOG85961.1 fumarylacetoacetate hydrolase [Streptomyces varsoviensis]
MRIGNVRGRPWLITGEGEGIDIYEASGHRFGPDLPALYERWDEFADWEPAAGRRAGFTPADLGAPSPNPRQVFAIGLNYYGHVREAGLEVPTEPSVFTKYVSSFAGAESSVELPPGTVDWEVEIAVVIGRTAREVAAGDAWRYVAGLTVAQDLSERGLQLAGAPPQYSLGKSFPGFGPTGPFLVTPDEFADPADLELGCVLNGEPVQKARSTEMVFPIDVLIEKVSQVTTLFPGDVVFTGTPAGVGAVRTPPRFLAAGDELVSYVEGIGSIRQTFTAAGRAEGSAS